MPPPTTCRPGSQRMRSWQLAGPALLRSLHPLDLRSHFSSSGRAIWRAAPASSLSFTTTPQCSISVKLPTHTAPIQFYSTLCSSPFLLPHQCRARCSWGPAPVPGARSHASRASAHASWKVLCHASLPYVHSMLFYADQSTCIEELLHSGQLAVHCMCPMQCSCPLSRSIVPANVPAQPPRPPPGPVCPRPFLKPRQKQHRSPRALAPAEAVSVLAKSTRQSRPTPSKHRAASPLPAPANQPISPRKSPVP